MKKNWFFYFEGQRAVGPLEQADIIERIQNKKLGPYQLLIRDGEEEWRPALAFSEFRSYLANALTNKMPNQSWVILKKQDAGGHLEMQSVGPFTSEQVREFLQSGAVDYTDYAWREGMHHWRRISSLREFSPFEKPIATPEPLVDMPSAPQIAKQVTTAEALKNVEVLNRKPKVVQPELPPKEAAGPDLTKKPELPPEPPPQTRPAGAKPSVQSEGSEGERRRLPRSTSYVTLTPKSQEEVAIEKPRDKKTLPTPEEYALDKTVVIEQSSNERPKRTGVSIAKEEITRGGVRGEKTQGGARDEKTRDEKTKSGVNLLSQERETSTTKVGEIVNARISLPRNWKQILVILVLLGALYLKLFGGPDFIPLSQVPMFSPPSTPEAQMPPPSEAPPATPQPPATVTPLATVTPPSPRSHVSPPQAVPPVASQEESPNDNVDDDTNSDVPGDEAIRRPTPQEIAAAKRKNKPHQATKLHAHMSVQSDGGASLQVDTDAPSTQPVLIEISAGAGQVLDHSHFYRRARWTPGKGVSLGGELPSGYYKLRASVGNLSTEEKFEIGTHVKGFSEKLKQTRKQSAYEFWNERKHLYQAAQHLGKLIGTKRFSEIDRLSRFQATSFAFSDLWNDLKEICQLVKKSDPSAKGRLQTLQNKIAALSIWK